MPATIRPRPAVDRRHDLLLETQTALFEAADTLADVLADVRIPTPANRHRPQLSMLQAADFSRLDEARRHYETLHRIYARQYRRHADDLCCVVTD